MKARRSTAIAAAFGRADDYDRHARVQRVAAEALANRIAALGLESPRVLEFGCGTGFLTEAVAQRCREMGLGRADVSRGEWLATDLAPGMVERCRQRMAGHHHVTFAVLDAACDEPPSAGTYDLVTASLAAQWLDDLDQAVARMLRWVRPGGHLLFNTLGSATFREWRDALAAAGAEAGTPAYPSVEAIAAIRPGSRASPPQTDMLIDRHRDARSFLAAIKAIGAHVPAEGHHPIGAAKMRAAMHHFEQAGSTASYEVVTLHFRRSVCEDS